MTGLAFMAVLAAIVSIFYLETAYPKAAVAIAIIFVIALVAAFINIRKSARRELHAVRRHSL